MFRPIRHGVSLARAWRLTARQAFRTGFFPSFSFSLSILVGPFGER